MITKNREKKEEPVYLCNCQTAKHTEILVSRNQIDQEDTKNLKILLRGTGERQYVGPIL